MTNMDLEWLERQTSLAEIEAQQLESNAEYLKNAIRKKRAPKGKRDQRRLKEVQERLERNATSMQSRWELFMAEMREDDEVWTYSSPRELWDQLMGSAGYAIVRNGEIIRTLMTRMN